MAMEQQHKMLEFEKWFKKVMVPRMDKGEVIYKGDCRLAWIAVLEWILSIDSGFCTYDCLNDSWQEKGVLAKIEKELGIKND